MSYRGSNRGRSGDDRSPNDQGSVFDGGSAGGPPLPLLIGACILLGIAGLALTIIVGSQNGGQQAAAQPAAVSGAAGQPAIQPSITTTTMAPAGTAATTGAPGTTGTAGTANTAGTAGPAAGGANAAGGSALATGNGEALAIETNPDALAFSVASLEAPANTAVTLTFNNNTNLGVQHNWVLVDGDDTVAAAVNTASGTNAAALFVPPAGTPDGLAWTAMTNAGQQSTVTFTTPAAGTYTFLCTFPGHYIAGMKGEFVVQ